MKLEHILLFAAIAAVTWFAAIYFWPRMLLWVFKRAILVKGFGDGPVPVNTLYTEPQALFADPLHPPATGSKLMSVGVNRDTLATAGWLDLSKGPQVLRVPDMDGRYYSLQLTNPSNNTNFAYIGKRATGTEAGGYLITGPGWSGQVPGGLTRIASPSRQVFVLGRVLVRGEDDLKAAYELSKQIQLTPMR